MNDIIWQKWKIKEQFAAGKYSKLYKLENIDTHEISALKVIIIKNDELNYQEHLDGIHNEVKILQKLSNKNISKYYEYYEEIVNDETIIYIRTDYLTTIEDYYKNNVLTENNVIKILTDIINALKVCKDNNIVHRDIKPNNILMNNKEEYILGDFNIASIINMKLDTKNIKNSFISPEIYNNQEIDYRSDIYSLGIVLYVLLNNGKIPFMDKNFDEDTAFKMRLNGIDIPRIKNIDKNLMNIIMKMIQFKKEDRYQDYDLILEDLNRVNINSSFKIKKTKISLKSETLDIYSDKAMKTKKRFSFKVLKNIIYVIFILGLLLSSLYVISSFYPCDKGFVNKNGKCIEGKYICPDNYTLNKKNKCVKAVETVDARKSVYCDDGYVFSEEIGKCLLPETKQPTFYYSCPDGAELVNNNKCKIPINFDPVTTYTCPTNYTYIPVDGRNLCIDTSKINNILIDDLTCSDGILYNGNCIKTDFFDATKKVSCVAGKLENGKCYEYADAMKLPKCDSGYEWYGAICIKQDKREPVIKYSCSRLYEKSKDKCVKYETINPIISKK